MYHGGTEVIVGLNQDAQFGPVIMFGLGGIFTEVLEDIVFRVVPISDGDARAMIREVKGQPVLAGYRRQSAVSEDMLVELLMKTNGWLSSSKASSAPWISTPSSSGETSTGCWTRRSSPRPMQRHALLGSAKRQTSPISTRSSLRAQWHSWVLRRASTKIGGAVLESLSRHGYTGKVFPVNPTRDEVMGLKAFASLRDVPEPVDLVVVTVPLELVPDLINQCAVIGTRNMVVISSGGKELGGQGEELEATIRRLARENDVRVVGCNCIGVLDSESRFDTFFYAPERMIRPPKGSVALITQSGTVGAVFLERLSGAGISKFVSYGNRIDVDEGDLVAYLGNDPATNVIACYIEGLEDGRKFLRAASAVSKYKPVVVFKAARSGRAAKASVSHTGFLGGSHRVIEGAFKQADIISVDSIDELVAAAKSLSMQPAPPGRSVGLISNGAGAFVQAIDLLEAYGLELPQLSGDIAASLKAQYPTYYVVQNPIDVTGSATSGDYEKGIEALLQDPGTDIVMPWFVFQNSPLDEGIVEVLARLNNASKPIVCGAMGGPYTQKMSQAIEAHGVPVFHSVRDWVSAAYALSARSR